MKVNVSFPKSIKRAPQDSFDHAASVMRRGQPAQAIPILEELRDQNTGDVKLEEILSILGVAYVMNGRVDEGIQSLRAAIDENPDFPKPYHNLCLTYTQVGLLDEAIACGNEALERGLEEADFCNALSNAYRRAGNLEKAIEIMEKALKHRDDDPDMWRSYGSWLFEAGDKEKSHECFAKALKLAPNNAAAHRMLSQVHTYEDKNDSYLQQLHMLAESNLPPKETAYIRFSLGKAYEDIGDYEASFQNYKAGNAAHRQTFQYDVADSQRFAEQLKLSCPDAKSLNTGTLAQDDKAPTPIFIVGMPRSGTSLIEQILASHSAIFGAGEQRDIEFLQFNTLGMSHDNYSQDWNDLSDQTKKDIATQYRAKLSSLSKGENLVCDKMPTNFLYLGAIAQLFPDAKIIHCVRSPQAICFSIFKILFGGHMFFGYDQKELAAYYRIYQDVMAHWNSVLGARIHTVTYEELIANPREETQNLLQYCGVEWEESCMDFHTTKRAVTTASTLQVRQPIYKSAMEHWKNFEAYMDPEILKLV